MRITTAITIAIVVDLNVFRAPDDINRKIRGEAKAYCGAKALGPALDGAKLRL
jgi:hypothetical protein